MECRLNSVEKTLRNEAVRHGEVMLSTTGHSRLDQYKHNGLLSELSNITD